MACRLHSRLILLLLLSSVPLEGREWPRWRGSDFNGTSRERNVFPEEGFALEVLWRTALGSGYSGVVVSEGTAVTLFSDGQNDYVGALDAETGRERWRVPIAPTYRGRDGANDGPVSTPAIDAGVVYALGPRGDLVAIRLDSGERIWKRSLSEEPGFDVPHWGAGTSPLVAGAWVVVGTGGENGAITAFDKHTGTTAWRAGGDAVSYQSPILWSFGGRDQLVAAGDTALFAVDVSDGRELWRYQHEGAGFYRRIVNPVVAGPAELLLTNGRMDSRLIRVANGPEGYRTEVRWTSRHLKLNYATPVFYEGHLYGFSGAFLSCIDAETGAMRWKSRPPGNGFPIVVDGHLVVLTKEGTLHVAEARPDGYRERASLAVLPRLTWTPPSFANGRVYARDTFADVVAVRVVPRAVAGVADSPSHASGLVAGTEFSRWLQSLEEAEDQEATIRRYLAAQPAFPIVEDDRFVHFVYHGDVSDVALRGGMLGAKTELPMHRVPGTDFYHASFEIDSDARLQYQFVLDLERSVPDPLNPTESDSLVYPGPVSVLLGPRAERGVEARARASGVGRVESVPFATEEVRIGDLTWGGERSVRVYLPHGYDMAAAARFPVLYVLYGDEMLEGAGLEGVLDALIGEQAIEPVLAVFVSSTSAYEYARSQREEHRRMLVEELVPLVDSRYRTLPDPASRAIVGADEAGFAALETALQRPDTFGKVGAQSVLAIGGGAAEILATIDAAPLRPLEIYLDWGRYDHSNDATETDIPGFSRTLRARLEAKGYDVSGREWNDSSDVAIWGWRFAHLARELYATKGKEAQR